MDITAHTEQGLVERRVERKKLILLIDDTIELLQLNSSILEMEGYEVLTASGGREALTLLLTGSIAPDLILLDVRMQGLSGVEFLSLFEQKLPQLATRTPVVFLTALEEAPAGKVAGIIKKPYEIDSFLRQIQGFLEGGVDPVLH